MLIRIVNHHVLNPHLIDKLIVIKGLPYEWIFRKVPQGDELLRPWEPDVEENIPMAIRHLCDPVTYCRWFAAVRHYDKTYEGFWDTRKALGLKIDYAYGPGQETWDKIEDYIEGTIPRTEKVPVPVLVAPDQKSLFSPYLAKKSERGGLQLFPSEIPVVDLTVYQKPEEKPAPPPMTGTLMVPSITLPEPGTSTVAADTAILLKCPDCVYMTNLEKSLRMHQMRKHPKRQKVSA